MHLRPTTVAAGGDAIARDEDGKVVFVAGGLPDELLDVRIVESRKDYARAEVVDVISPSPFRIEAPCAARAGGCGGCAAQHVTAEGQRAIKRDIVVDAIRRIGRIDDPPVAATVAMVEDEGRTTVRAAVRDGIAGHRRAASHDVVTTDECLAAHPLVADLLVSGRYGSATEVVLRCGARTGERLAAPDPADAVIRVPADVRSDHVHEVVAGRTWRVSAGSFFQPRPQGADVLASLVINATAGRDGDAVDLYSGVGLFAGVLADRGWRVTAVEGDPSAVADAQVNLAGSGVRVVAGDVRRWAPTSAEVVVADPSRSGLARDGVAVAVGCGTDRIVLVSCDPAALGRDARLLAEAGYRLVGSTPVDQFPDTFHIEVVTIFDR